jgi:hypothetical protein
MKAQTMSAWMRSFYKLSLSAAVFCVLSIGYAVSTSGQDAQESITVGNAKITGVPEDWTHHHAVFSDPGTEADALKNGTYSEWSKIVNDPRYIIQQLKRRLPAQGPAAEDVTRIEEEARARQAARAEEITAAEAAAPEWGRIKGWSRPKIAKDWSMVLGPSATVGAGNYPAKFSFFPNATPNCAGTSSPDFVVYNTSVVGSSTQASIVAYDNLYATTCASDGPIPTVYWAFNTGGTVKTSVVLSLTGSQVIFVQSPSPSGNPQVVLLKWAALPAGRSVTATATIHSTAFTVSATTPLTSMDVGAQISGTGIPAGDTIAAVGSATGGTLATQTTAALTGEPVNISADAGGPDTLTAVTPSNYSGCMAPCMTTLSFSGSSRSDNFSSPYYDYSHDTLYVGDTTGGLHKFTPVLNGTLTEVETSGGPWAQTASGTALSSPVYDETTGDVYAGDASGFLYSVSSSGIVTPSVQVANSPGIVDSPLVDLSAGQIYAFVPQDYNSTNSSTSPCAASGSGDKTICNGVIQLPAGFSGTSKFTESVFGVGTTNTLYIGAFDNNYETSGTGNIYATGATGANLPKLMETPVTTSGFNGAACQSGTGLPTGGSALQCSTSIVTMTSAAAAGAPVVEILNGTTDRIFTGVAASSDFTTAPSGCANGNACVLSWTATSTISAGTSPSAGMVLAGGPSGVIIDNTSSLTGTSQIYCGTLGTAGSCTTSGTFTKGGCAVQAAQSGL